MDKVLHASKAGFPCLRNIYYAVNDFEGAITPQTQDNLDTAGIEWLSKEGWSVDYNSDIEVKIPVRGGSIIGHPKCIISHGDMQNVLIVIKKMDEETFTQRRPQYVTQLHAYAMCLINAGRKVEHLGILGVKGKDAHLDIFGFNRIYANQIIREAEKVFAMKEAPEENCPSETEACNEYVRAVTRKTLCAAVKRIYTPGIKFDCILILNGPQGIGKSTLIAKLGMQWFSDSLTLSDMNDKTAAEKLQGYWIHEIGEMAGMRKADLEKVKSFISRQDDKYRAAFGHRVTPHPRQCVFFGTTNAEDGFLRDVTGNRRYWVVPVPGGAERKPWELTQEDINQIWAEVLVKVEAGEELYLSGDVESIARREQSRAMERDEREGLVRMYLDTLLPENWESMDLYSRKEYLWGDEIGHKEGTIRRETVSNMEIWCECFGNAKEAIKPTDSYAISSIMSRIEGWNRSEKYIRSELYGKQRIYMRDGTSDAVMEVVL